MKDAVMKFVTKVFATILCCTSITQQAFSASISPTAIIECAFTNAFKIGCAHQASRQGQRLAASKLFVKWHNDLDLSHIALSRRCQLTTPDVPSRRFDLNLTLASAYADVLNTIKNEESLDIKIPTPDELGNNPELLASMHAITATLLHAATTSRIE